MKFASTFLLLFSLGAQAQTYVSSPLHVGTGANPNSTYVQPYVSHSGSYVEGYHRTVPDTSVSNNYSTLGNVNPYTGATGMRSSCSGYGCR